MTNKQPDPKLLEQAALIFLRLQEEPKNQDALDACEAFLASGPEHRLAFEQIKKSWTLSGARLPRKRSLLLPLLLGIGSAIYLFAQPVRIAMLADAATHHQTERVALQSGDTVTMDAGTALRDDSDAKAREIRLLQGAALFNVSKQERPFSVRLGEVNVQVRSTVFETAYTPDALTVSVVEGIVDVSGYGRVLTLEAGDRVRIDASGSATMHAIDPTTIATWQHDKLTVTNTTLRELAEIIDRRLPGEVLVIGSDFSEIRISGSFGLTDPSSALRSLAAISGGRLISGGPLGAILMARN